MKTLILSDIHLDANEDGRQNLLDFARDFSALVDDGVERIIILGDLFDFWFEYRHVIFSGYFDILRTFARMRDRGIAFHLICGNHDFWAGRFLHDHLGFEIHSDTAMMDFDGRRVLFVHGDGFNPKDAGYRLYKRIARNRVVVRLFAMLHPDLAMGIARRVSRTSRRLTRVDDPTKGSEARALAAHAQRILAEGQADIIMAGHAHAPAMMDFPTPNGHGLYINTGDWMYHRSYVIHENGQFHLLRAEQPPASQATP